MPAEVYPDTHELHRYLRSFHPEDVGPLVTTSGGFDPLHVGHLRCIQETAGIARDKMGIAIIIVNGDGFLERKKGHSFMQHAERMEIIAGIEGVDFVTGWDDGSQTVSGAIEVLQPNFFTKGGDRDASHNVAEFELCESIGCKIIFNVGGGKVQSSSTLVETARRHNARDGT